MFTRNASGVLSDEQIAEMRKNLRADASKVQVLATNAAVNVDLARQQVVSALDGLIDKLKGIQTLLDGASQELTNLTIAVAESVISG